MIDIKTNKMKNGSMLTRFLALSLIALGFLIPNLPAQAERTTTYYVSDALGSPIVAMDEQGEVLWRKSYLPYGKQGNVDPDDDKDTAYTGKKLDRDTGLIYFGARWYDPEAGRFTGVDPVGFVESNPQSFNRYAYANNNPYRYIDPDGRFAKELAVPIIILGGGVIAYGSCGGSGNPWCTAVRGLGDRLIDSLGNVLHNEGVTDEHDPVDDVLEGATPGEKTKGRTKNFDKSGGFDQANDDFDKLVPDGGEPIVDSRGGEGRKGTTKDGRKVNVRPNSTDGRPTLEIQKDKNKTKVRYSD